MHPNELVSIRPFYHYLVQNKYGMHLLNLPSKEMPVGTKQLRSLDVVSSVDFLVGPMRSVIRRTHREQQKTLFVQNILEIQCNTDTSKISKQSQSAF